MNLDKILTVRLNNKFVGYLGQNEYGKLVFTYSPKYQGVPLSLCLPLRSEPYEEAECGGFFEGLLPEGEEIRNFIGKKYGINPKNKFSLLKAIGYDCAGAVSFSEYESEPMDFKNDFIQIDGNIFTENALEEYIKSLPIKPLLTSSDGLRLSLAGAQDKMAIVLINNKIALPNPIVPTTHIIKSEIKGIEYSVENEYICLQAAAKMGLNVCDAKIGKTENLKYLLIKRFDREVFDKKIRRIHQEDFCQAKNIPSVFKYEREGGISIKDCFEIIRKTNTPAKNLLELVNRIIFNYLIGNSDAHGKNFSLLYTNSGIEFAPAYDILCTSVYSNLTTKMAMKIGGHYEPENIYPRHWEEMSKEAGINYTQIKKIIIKQAKTLPLILSDVISKTKSPIGEKILNIAKSNCERTIKRLS